MQLSKDIALVEGFDDHDEISAIMMASLVVVAKEAKPPPA